MFGLGEAGFAVGADLNGVFGADEERLDLTVLEFGEMFGNFIGVVKAAAADMVAGGGEGNDDGAFW